MFKIHILGYGCIYNSSSAYDKTRFIQDPVLDMQDANGAGSLKFKISPDMEGYSDIDLLKTTLYVTRKNNATKKEDVVWAGRVLEESRDEYNDRVIECEGALAYLNDSIQPYSKVVGQSDKVRFEKLINFHNSLMTDNSRKFDITELLASTNSYLTKIQNELRPAAHIDVIYDPQIREPKSTLELLTSQFLNRWGGYFKLTYELIDDPFEPWIKNTLNYIDAYDTSMNPVINQPIQFGKNLISLKRTAYADDFATILYPIGATLDDVDKAYVYCAHSDDNAGHYRLYGDYPGVYNESEYLWHHRIDPETGYTVYAKDARFAITHFLSVAPGERYFLTTYMQGIPVTGSNGQSKDNDGVTPLGAATYAIYKSDQATKVEIGTSVRNSTSKDDSTGVVTEQTVDTYLDNQEITIPEEGAFLVIAGFDVNRLNKKIKLKKFNPDYAEETVSIMSIPIHEATATDPIEKYNYLPYGTDVYPGNTVGDSSYEGLFEFRIIKHTKLLEEFGPIIKTIEFDDVSNVEYLYNKSADALRRMTEKVELEVEAADLSFIDDKYESFDILSSVQVKSNPHSLDTVLPILRLEIPLDSPEKAKYTLANEVETRDGTPSYMTVYMSDMYKKGRA